MKKSLFLFLLLSISSVGYSCEKCSILIRKYFTSVVIENKTKNDCHLIQHIVKKGEWLTKSTNTIVKPGQMSQPSAYMLLGEESNTKQIETDVILNFQCGFDQYVTLEIQRALTRDPEQEEWFNSTFLSIINLDAQTKYKPLVCEKIKNGSNPQIVNTFYLTLNELPTSL